jgi:hypothetical protein
MSLELYNITGQEQIENKTWCADKEYFLGQKVKYENNNYKCIAHHQSISPRWNPESASSLWEKV